MGIENIIRVHPETRVGTASSRSIFRVSGCTLSRKPHAPVGIMFLLIGVSNSMAQPVAKFEPPAGQVYHGAFPVSQGSTLPGDYWLDISSFENLAGKNLAIVLWYADWNSSFQASVGYLIDQHLKPKGKVIEVGWMPNGVPLDAIIAGTWDSYLRQWFTDARDNGEPIFLRFASEMNGSWVDYGGWQNGGNVSTSLGWSATEKYKVVWRHVYGIARQMQACNVAFVWAPNYLSGPNPDAHEYRWNHWQNYYPGDEYVDWVGVDLYDFEGRDPRDSIRPFYDEYAARKPIMLAETAGHDDVAGADKVRYIQQLFDAVETDYPRLKAVVWFNYYQPSFNWRIDEASASLDAYRNRVANARYVTAVDRNVADALSQPSAQSICPGSTATFTLGVVDDGTLSYRWQKNGLNIVDGGHYSGARTATLAVSNAEGKHAANYRCILTGGCAGSSTSNPAALTVLATTIVQQPVDQTAVRGGGAVFTVAVSGEGMLSYQWQKNGTNLTNGGHYSGAMTTTLTISACNGTDVGDYRCVIASDCGSKTSNVATLSLTQLGDFDLDDDVDQEDFGHLQVCLTAPTIPQTDPGCQDAKLDDDDIVDQSDLALFLKCFSGPNVPADPSCSN